MKVIVAGSRSVNNYDRVEKIIKASGFSISTIISGGARGVDTLGEQYALKYGIELERYPADWDLHGKKAGYIRNQLMADQADALIAIWDDLSKGTKHMIDIAYKKGLKVYVVLV